MTMTRALNELDGVGLGTIVMEGRERVLRFNRDKKQVWETALKRLRSPVKKRLWVKIFSDRLFGVRAGLSALAHYSNLAEPLNPVLALENDGQPYPPNITSRMEVFAHNVLRFEPTDRTTEVVFWQKLAEKAGLSMFTH